MEVVIEEDTLLVPRGDILAVTGQSFVGAKLDLYGQ